VRAQGVENSRGFAGRMKVQVKLFGTLVQSIPGYDFERGMEVEIPSGSKIRDLLTRLGISESGVVAVDGLIMKGDEGLEGGSSVHIFQPVFGG
jgi:sulfur carrier protein ThiS